MRDYLTHYLGAFQIHDQVNAWRAQEMGVRAASLDALLTQVMSHHEAIKQAIAFLESMFCSMA